MPLVFDEKLLPSVRAEQQAKEKAEAEKLAQARISEMRRDFTLTFQTEHGKRVLQWLRERCGHNKVILSANRTSGTIDPMMTVFAAMELNLYLEIRKNLPTEQLEAGIVTGKHYAKSTGSHPNSEVKRHKAWLVLRVVS